MRASGLRKVKARLTVINIIITPAETLPTLQVKSHKKTSDWRKLSRTKFKFEEEEEIYLVGAAK